MINMSESQKISWNLLAPNLQNIIIDLENRQITNDGTNTNSISNLSAKSNQVRNLLAQILALPTSLYNRYNTLKTKISSYTGRDGRGDGIKFAYQYGLPGQLLKTDEEQYNRIFPYDNFTTCRLCTVSDQATVLGKAAWDPNDKYAYNTESHTAYYRSSNGTWYYMDPVDQSKLLFLHKTFILDPITKIFWFAQDPSTFIYLWKATTVYTNVTNTSITPRDQEGVDFVVDSTTTDWRTGGPLPSPSEAMKRVLKPDITYESYSKFLIGDQMYDATTHQYTYYENSSQFNFIPEWSGKAKLTITVSFNSSDIIGPSFMERDEYFVIENEKKTAKPRYSDGTLKVSLNDRPDEDTAGNLISTNLVQKNYGNWEYTAIKTTTLLEGPNYISCWTKATARNHLYVTKIKVVASYA